MLLVFDQKAKRQLNLHVGDRMKTFWGNDARVLGFTDEVVIASTHKASELLATYPVSFVTNEELYMPYAYIKLMPGADKGNVLLYIRNMLNELSPSCLPDLSFAIHSPGICMKKKSSLATGLFYPVFYLSGWHWQVF